MYVPLSDDKHRFVRDSPLGALDSETTSETNFFLTIFFFQQKIVFSDFVSDYILDLYFVTNHLISLISKTGILYYISKVECVNSFEYKNSRTSNFSHLNLSFQ